MPGTVSRVVLVGFMGAGKSTVGPLLASLLRWTFVDADQYLETTSGFAVAEIFERHGEGGFRRMEAESIQSLLENRHQVLALGGGALEAASTRSLVVEMPETAVIFLDAPADTLIARCEEAAQSKASSVRPLFEELRSDRERLEQKLAARLPHYRMAHLTIATGGLTAQEVALEISAEISRTSLHSA